MQTAFGIDWYEFEDVVEAGINPNWLAFRVNRSERSLPFRDIRTELYTLHSIVSESSRHRLRERTDREERQALHSSIRTFFDAAFPPQPHTVLAALKADGFDPDAILSEDDLRTLLGSLYDRRKLLLNSARFFTADDVQSLREAYEQDQATAVARMESYRRKREQQPVTGFGGINESA